MYSSSNSSQVSSSSLDLTKSTEFLSEESTKPTASPPLPRSISKGSLLTRSPNLTSRNSYLRKRKSMDRLSSIRLMSRLNKIYRISRERNKSKYKLIRFLLRIFSNKILYSRDIYRLDSLSERICILIK